MKKPLKHCLFILALLAIQPTWAERQQPTLGHTLSVFKKQVMAPDFSLPDMDDKLHSLKAYKGNVVLLNFWATWCPPCRREMPSMERLSQRFIDSKLKIIAINQMEDSDQVFAFTASLDTDPTFTILFDKESTTAHGYNVQGLPTTFLIDKKGMIRYRAIGGREFDHPDVEKLIQKLLDEESPAG